MSRDARRIVLMARYTSLVGPSSGSFDFHSAPVNVREFSRADVCTWRGSLGAGTATVKLQESPDLATWSDKGTVTLSDHVEDVTTFTPLDTEWVRLKVTLTNDAKVTFWVVADCSERGT